MWKSCLVVCVLLMLFLTSGNNCSNCLVRFHISPTKPFVKNPFLDYEEDFDDGWEEEPEGESLSVSASQTTFTLGIGLLLSHLCTLLCGRDLLHVCSFLMIECCSTLLLHSMIQSLWKADEEGEDEVEDKESQDGFVVDDGYLSEDEGLQELDLEGLTNIADHGALHSINNI